MTEQTTPHPTPAQDALAAAVENFQLARAAFFAETVESLTMSMTAKEAIAEARRLTPWATKQQATKAAAIRVIANDRWGKTEAVKAHTALKRAAVRESEILKAIADAPGIVASAKQDVITKASAEHAEWNTERLLDEVVGLQHMAEVAGLWGSVEYAIREQGLSPLEALVAVREHTTSELLTQVRYGNSSSNSTRNLSNLTKAAATAKWLEETARLVN